MNGWFTAAVVLMGAALGIILAAVMYHLPGYPGAFVGVFLCLLSVVCSGIGANR